MSQISFTFPVGYPSHNFAEIDGVAEIGPDGVEDIKAYDLKTKEMVWVSADVEKAIHLYLRCERTADLREAIRSYDAGRRQDQYEAARAA